jgi:predicted O-linked N-acetylglucosamine transferase (SPINDLY family)
LDVAFDLGGHTAHYLKLFAERMAPVQISYLGYPATTGLTTMDYRITDEICDPVGTDRWHSEKLYRMAAPMWAYMPPEIELTPAPCLENGYITFGSFNNFGKLTDEILAVWGEIMAAAPTARLIFKSTGLCDPLLAPVIDARLDKAKLDPERVTLIGNIKGNVEHLNQYGRMDISLDPSPFNGVTTTCEALWCGCPVITLAGTRHSSRTGMSLLTSIGREEWIARNTEEYVAVAVEMAKDAGKLAETRGGLREAMKKSALMDYAGHAKRFGEAIRNCWKEYCAK